MGSEISLLLTLLTPATPLATFRTSDFQKRMCMRFLISVVFLLDACLAFAWGDLGHQTVAEIAEKNLTARARQGIVNILGPEALALAAIWPDQVRDDRQYDPFKDYHFVEIPAGKDYATMTLN